MTPASRDTRKETAPEDSLQEPLGGLSVELGRISAEIQSINEGFQVQMMQVVSEVREQIANEYRARFDKSVENLREQIRTQIRAELEKEYQEKLAQRIGHLVEARKEIEVVRGIMERVAKEIAAMLDDPSVELAKVMRKRTQQAELKAYMDGLRFSIGEKPGEKPKTQSAGK